MGAVHIKKITCGKFLKDGRGSQQICLGDEGKGKSKRRDLSEGG